MAMLWRFCHFVSHSRCVLYRNGLTRRRLLVASIVGVKYYAEIRLHSFIIIISYSLRDSEG